MSLGFKSKHMTKKRVSIPALFPNPWSASAYPSQILKPDLSILRTPLHPGTAKSNPNTKPRTLLFPLGNVRDSVTEQQLAKYILAAESYANQTKKIPKTGQKQSLFSTKGPRPSRLAAETFFIDQS